MKISRVSLKNFKCFKEAELNLSKITLLTGANSSGKNSFIYSILAMLQSEKFPFYLSPNGEFVDLGSFEEISFGNKHKQAIEISVDLNESLSYDYLGPVKIKTSWIENIRNKLPQLDELSITSKGLQIHITKKEKKYYLSISDSTDTGYILKKLKPRLLKIKEIEKAQTINISKKVIEIIEAPFDSVNSIFQKTFFSDVHFFSKYIQVIDDCFKKL